MMKKKGERERERAFAFGKSFDNGIIMPSL